MRSSSSTHPVSVAIIANGSSEFVKGFAFDFAKRAEPHFALRGDGYNFQPRTVSKNEQGQWPEMLVVLCELNSPLLFPAGVEIDRQLHHGGDVLVLSSDPKTLGGYFTSLAEEHSLTLLVRTYHDLNDAVSILKDRAKAIDRVPAVSLFVDSKQHVSPASLLPQTEFPFHQNGTSQHAIGSGVGAGACSC